MPIAQRQRKINMGAVHANAVDIATGKPCTAERLNQAGPPGGFGLKTLFGATLAAPVERLNECNCSLSLGGREIWS